MTPPSAEPALRTAPRPCWCGSSTLAPFSDAYLRCETCGTLVSQADTSRNELRVRREDEDLYGLNYFEDHARALGHPGLVERSRLDLSERCVYWLKALLRRRAPPARTLELGCANGSFVGLLAEAGYDATGLDLSPAVTGYVQRTFQVPVLTGPLEDQELAPGSLDVILMMDVLEHLPDPLRTLRTAADLLRPDGLLLVQTPHYEGATFDDMKQAGAPFLDQLKPEEHLFLLGRSSAIQLMSRGGFSNVVFEPAIFAQYDQFFVASRASIPTVPEAAWRDALRRSRGGRVVEALADACDRAAEREREQATFRGRLGLLFRPPRRPGAGQAAGPDAPGSAATGRAALDLPDIAVLRGAFGLDWEQLLAFQYSKLVSRGDRVIDVGAHAGLHTARLVQLVGPDGSVVMVEPLPQVVDAFLRPLYGERRGCRIFQGALADHAGTAPFHVATGSEQESGLRRKRSYVQRPSGPGTEIEVRLSTLDELAGDGRVSFVKIDVEGAELEVLRGARKTLAASRPVIAVETSSESIAEYGGSPGALFDFLVAEGYGIFSLLGEPLDREALEALASSGVLWDFFLVPNEERERVCALLLDDRSPYLVDRFVDLRATHGNPQVAGLSGFSFLESWGRWTDARLAAEATIQLAAPLPRRFDLELVGMGSHPRRTEVDVVVEGARRTLSVSPTIGALSCSFETSGEATTIAFRPHAPVRTADARPGADPRRRGLGLQSIRVVPARR